MGSNINQKGDGMQEFLKKIHWLGHASFRIEGSKILYIDPFEIKKGPQADIILISHEHYDHCSPEDAKKIQGPDTVIVTEKDSKKKLSGEVKTLAPNEVIEVKGVKIKAIPAYNVAKDFHPKKKGWIGFFIEMDGFTLYHTGDSDLIPEMEGLRPDVAFLPVSGTYVMDASMAAEAALKIQPKVVIPMHYGSFIGSTSDANRLKEALKGRIEVVILKKE